MSQSPEPVVPLSLQELRELRRVVSKFGDDDLVMTAAVARQLLANLDMAALEASRVVSTVVHTVGGTVEGHPTSTPAGEGGAMSVQRWERVARHLVREIESMPRYSITESRHGRMLGRVLDRVHGALSAALNGSWDQEPAERHEEYVGPEVHPDSGFVVPERHVAGLQALIARDGATRTYAPARLPTISELATVLGGEAATLELPVNDGGTTRKISVGQLAEALRAASSHSAAAARVFGRVFRSSGDLAPLSVLADAMADAGLLHLLTGAADPVRELVGTRLQLAELRGELGRWEPTVIRIDSWSRRGSGGEDDFTTELTVRLPWAINEGPVDSVLRLAEARLRDNAHRPTRSALGLGARL